jgi:hypothetical protein
MMVKSAHVYETERSLMRQIVVTSAKSR